MSETAGHVTHILRRAEGGGEAEILPFVYDELRSIARGRMARERAGHTLEATELVHEAYGRLVEDAASGWSDRRQFYSAAAEAMQRVLVDHARRSGSQERRGGFRRVTLGSPDAPMEMDATHLVALDGALRRLEAEDPRAANVARLRFLVGLTVEETAHTLEITERAVIREWTYARARLSTYLGA